MRRYRILGAVLAVLAWAVPGGAGSFLNVKPSLLELPAEPGRAIRGRFQIRNTGPDKVPVEIEVQDGWTRQVGHPSSVPPEKWLFLKIPKKLVLRPGGAKTISYRIAVPRDLSGEVLALVFFSAPSARMPGQPMNLRLRHGIPIYLSAKGTERAELSVSEANASVLPGGEVEASVTLVSDGNTHVRPRGDLRVTDEAGLEVETIPLDYGAPVFPGGRQKYYARSKRKDWVTGTYKAHLIVTYGDNFGPTKTLKKMYALRVSEGKVSLLADEDRDAR